MYALIEFLMLFFLLLQHHQHHLQVERRSCGVGHGIRSVNNIDRSGDVRSVCPGPPPLPVPYVRHAGGKEANLGLTAYLSYRAVTLCDKRRQYGGDI